MLWDDCCSIPNVLAFLRHVEAAEVIQQTAFYVLVRNYCDSVLLALVHYKASGANSYAAWCHFWFFVVFCFCLWFFSNVPTFFLPQDVDYSMWNKKPTRCHLVLYLFLLCKLLNMFWATLCPSSGGDELVVFFPRVVYCRGCVGSQIWLAGCVSIGKYVAQHADNPEQLQSLCVCVMI